MLFMQRMGGAITYDKLGGVGQPMKWLFEHGFLRDTEPNKFGYERCEISDYGRTFMRRTRHLDFKRSPSGRYEYDV